MIAAVVKAKELGLRFKIAESGGTPVPVKLIVKGVLEALLRMLTTASEVPVAEGP